MNKRLKAFRLLEEVEGWYSSFYSNIKFRIVIWNTYLLLRFDKHITLSEKKLPLA